MGIEAGQDNHLLRRNMIGLGQGQNLLGQFFGGTVASFKDMDETGLIRLESNQRLFDPNSITGDHIGSALSDHWPKTEAAAELIFLDRLSVEDDSKVSDDVIRPCTSPFIDSLVVVPDYHDIDVLSCQKLDQVLLPEIDVLILIHNQVAQLPAELLIQPGILLQHVNGCWNEVIVGQGRL